MASPEAEAEGLAALRVRYLESGVHGAASTLLGDIVYMYVISAMWWVSVMLSDPTGTDTTDFDLSFDLENHMRATETVLNTAFAEHYMSAELAGVVLSRFIKKKLAKTKPPAPKNDETRGGVQPEEKVG